MSRKQPANLTSRPTQMMENVETDQCLLLLPSWPQQLLLSLHTMQKLESLCDVGICTASQSHQMIQVHAIILAAVSKRLRPRLEEVIANAREMGERSPQINVQLPNMSEQVASEVLRKIIEFIYSGKVTFSSSIDLDNIRSAATFLQIKPLVKLCKKVMAGDDQMFKKLDINYAKKEHDDAKSENMAEEAKSINLSGPKRTLSSSSKENLGRIERCISAKDIQTTNGSLQKRKRIRHKRKSSAELMELNENAIIESDFVAYPAESLANVQVKQFTFWT